jgi:P63C domain-containing protein
MAEQKIWKAVWGSPDRPLKIGDLGIPAYVLENGTRVLSGRGMQTALQLGQSHGSKLRNLLSSANIRPHISNELAMALDSPLRFVRPGRGGKLAVGYEATILPDICDAILEARKKEKLTPTEQLVADQCEILTRAFAKVGIIALIDEVTGYQEIRDREALQAILDKYLRKEYAAWAKRFPDDFYREMFRLRGWQWRGMKVNRPSIVAHYTKDLIYQRLAPGIMEKLERLNPRDEKGNRAAKHHQWLTNDIGVPALAQHLYATVGFMRAASTWDSFYRSMQRAFPKLNSNMVLNFPDETETGSLPA